MADPRPDEFPHVVPEAGERPPDLPVAALVDRHFEDRPRAALLDDVDAGAARAAFGEIHAATQPI